jgi:hypothetical protein
LIHFCSVLVLFRPFMSLTVHNRPYNKHNTNIHAPGGIRIHNPSKRAAEDPRLRPHGHWDRQVILWFKQTKTGFDPRTFQPLASRYTDWAIPAHVD